MPTIQDTIISFNRMVFTARSENTARSYKNALHGFSLTLLSNHLPTEKTEISELPEEAIAWFIADLKSHSASTERLYLTAVSKYYEYLSAENLLAPNLPRINLLIRQRARRPGQRLPQFPKEDIQQVILYMESVELQSLEDNDVKLRVLRDRAFLITLADTGLRVHEACNLRRGDVDWREGRAIILGKGNREDVIRFSQRSLQAIKAYLNGRSALDGSSGKPLATLPVFARHDPGAGKKTKKITTTTGRNIVTERVREALGEAAVGTITPHSFRHYFVTSVLQGSGNLKLAQELARHRNIAVTQRYAHLSNDELDKGYLDIFDPAEGS